MLTEVWLPGEPTRPVFVYKSDIDWPPHCIWIKKNCFTVDLLDIRYYLRHRIRKLSGSLHLLSPGYGFFDRAMFFIEANLHRRLRRRNRRIRWEPNNNNESSAV